MTFCQMICCQAICSGKTQDRPAGSGQISIFGLDQRSGNMAFVPDRSGGSPAVM